LIRLRPFQNWDPPGLAEIWRGQRPIRGRIQSLTPQTIEEHVLAKPWFDREGLIVACDDAKLVGFVHAGFGAACARAGLECTLGTTCLLLVAPHEDRPAIAEQLLAASEDYLRRRGAMELCAGSQPPINPFYLGLYGSSDVAGVLNSNSGWVNLLQNSGYRPKIRRVLAGRTLAGFRPPVDRKQMQVRRTFRVADPASVLPDNWWDACVWSLHEWTQFKLVLPNGGEPVISATFWDVEPLGRSWGVPTAGLIRVEDTPEAREAGMTTFLLGEALRHYQAAGYGQFEAQALSTDVSLRAIFVELGLNEYDEGVLWMKDK
jgi:GNAT superfamily N-acetyltransferase